VLTSPNPSEGGALDSLKLTDYESLARNVFQNLNPATDIYFSQGPMDVLDHSCTKLGFGGKMCIDGTFKYDEEKDDGHVNRQSPIVNIESSIGKKLMNLFPEIKQVNDSLLKKQIPCLIISVEKNRKNHVNELHQAIMQLEEAASIKMILYVEHTVNACDLPVALWRCCNNLDPKRDHVITKKQFSYNPDRYISCIGLDGTIKTKTMDGFQRDWPNIITADNSTIMSVDKKWDSLNIGPFIPSPSLKYKDQMYGKEAVAIKNE